MNTYKYCMVVLVLLLTIITTRVIGQPMKTPTFFTDKNRYISLLPPTDWRMHQPTTNDPRTKLIFTHVDEASQLPVTLTIIVYQVDKPLTKESLKAGLESKLTLLQRRGATFSPLKDVAVAQTDCIKTTIQLGDATSMLILGYPDKVLCLDIVYHAPNQLYDTYLETVYSTIDSLVTLKGAFKDDPILKEQQRLFWLKKQVALYMDEKDFDTARSMLNELVTADPDNFSLHFQLGMTHMMQQQYTKAQICFEKALLLFPKYWEAYFQSGVAAMHLENFEEAVDKFSKTLAINPVAIEAMVNQAIAYRKIGQPQKAVDIYKKLLDLNPTNQVYLFNLGRTYSDMGAFLEAKSAFEKCLESNPDNASAMVNLAYLYVSVSNFDKARELCESALSHDATLEEAKKFAQ